jgi:periodic tryptophan protein 1
MGHLGCLMIDIPFSQGKIFSASFSPDDPLTLAAAGSAAKLQIWDVGASQQVRKMFSAKLRKAGKAIKEKEAANGGVIGLVDDEESGEE